MLDSVRRKVGRAESALAFHRTQPSTDPGLVTLFDQLRAQVERATTLVGLRVDRDTEARNGTARREELRRLLRTGLLRVFSRAGQAAARVDAALLEKFPRVAAKGSGLAFASTARTVIEAAAEHAEALAHYGVTQEAVGEARTLLADYEAAAHKAVEARNGRIWARAELELVVGEVMDLLGRIDGLLRHRLAGSPERLTAWRSALAAMGPVHNRAKPTQPAPAPAPGTADTGGSSETGAAAA